MVKVKEKTGDRGAPGLVYFWHHPDHGGRGYVGRTTKTLPHRWGEHVLTARADPKDRPGCRRFNAAIRATIREGTLDQWVGKVLESGLGRGRRLKRAENRWIRKKGTLSPAGCNLCLENDGGGLKVSEETKKRLIAAARRTVTERLGFHSKEGKKASNAARARSAARAKTHRKQLRPRFVRLYLSGWLQEEIAKRFKTQKNFVHKVLYEDATKAELRALTKVKEKNERIGDNREAKETKDKRDKLAPRVFKLCVKGWSSIRIGKTLNVGSSVVQRICREASSKTVIAMLARVRREIAKKNGKKNGKLSNIQEIAKAKARWNKLRPRIIALRAKGKTVEEISRAVGVHPRSKGVGKVLRDALSAGGPTGEKLARVKADLVQRNARASGQAASAKARAKDDKLRPSVLRFLSQGWSQIKIARALRTTPPVIRRVLAETTGEAERGMIERMTAENRKRYGFKAAAWRSKLRPQVLKLRMTGLSYAAIEESIGVSYTSIRTICLESKGRTVVAALARVNAENKTGNREAREAREARDRLAPRVLALRAAKGWGVEKIVEAVGVGGTVVGVGGTVVARILAEAGLIGWRARWGPKPASRILAENKPRSRRRGRAA